MATVRDTDLPDLLVSLGYQVKRIGRYYTTQEMDSIRIKDRRTWFRYSEGIGGDAITFLQRFYNKSFPEAVEYLLTWHGRARDSPPVSTPRQTKEKEEKVPFTLPPANVDHRRVFAYLRKRGIAPQVIRGFVEAGLLYEDAQHHNCVFVGRDQSGAPVFANQRGTYDWNGSSFKGDVPGSNKDIAFRLYCSKKHDAVLVFEAPIDLMSFCTLHRKVTSNAVALCGLYEGGLRTYLRDNPHIYCHRQIYRHYQQHLCYRLHCYGRLYRPSFQNQLLCVDLYRHFRQHGGPRGADRPSPHKYPFQRKLKWGHGRN